LRLRWFESSPAHFQRELLAAIADAGGRGRASPAKMSIFDGVLPLPDHVWHVCVTSLLFVQAWGGNAFSRGAV
ncbi:MAG TPA: hypothetical protein VGQ95_00880, partial [Chthoniobacterales bacterium]|nr:hypothetical protein [Chthoniobacterales bacterium]